ncbi:MAG: redoxin domain-containing protein [Isosphaeraceae bacterium]
MNLPGRFAAALAGLALTLTSAPSIGQEPTATASEANPATPAAGHSIHGQTFDDGPRARAILLTGQGHGGFAITTKSPEAQEFFNQGVAQLHTFYYLESERSFRQASMIDPDAPMPYWGMAMSNVNNEKRARGFLEEARKKAAKVKLSRREQLYLDGLSAFHRDKGEAKPKREEWVKALETLVQEFPEELDARAWLAMITWQNSQKGDGIGSRQAVDELIESALRRDPAHPGALHYRIHLWDGVKPERALSAAPLYGPAAPAIAHAWHMPGHTYSGLHRYSEASYQQEASARVDHAAMARDRTMPFDIHNYAHNNQWLCTSLSHIGRARDGITVAWNLVEQPRDPQKNTRNDGGSPQRSGRARWSEILVRYELWDDLVSATNQGYLDWSDIPAERKERAYTLGIAYAHKGDREQLVEQIEALKALQPPDEPKAAKPDEKKDEPKAEEKKDEPKAEERKAEEKKDEPKAEEKKEEAKPEAKKDEAEAKKAESRPRAPRRPAAPPGLDAAKAELEAYLLMIDGQGEEALKLLEKATSMRPELKARMQLRLGKAEDAVATAKAAVDRGPGQLPPLASLVEMLDASGKVEEARAASEKLRKLDGEADADLPIIRRIAAIRARWQSEGWAPTPAESAGSADPTAPKRIPLDSLGTLEWIPTIAEPFTLTDTDGQPWSLGGREGKQYVLLFYLGNKCAHCMQQLQEFGKAYEDFRKDGVEVIGISTDDVETSRQLKANSEEVKFPMPLLSDPSLGVFRAYRCFDDFEGTPMHGTFLVDQAGRVRFSRISAEPFLDVKFVREEAGRVRKLFPRP